MEQFAFGSADAFENLWNRLAVAPKVIRYRVTLAPDIRVRSGAACGRGSDVRVGDGAARALFGFARRLRGADGGGAAQRAERGTVAVEKRVRRPDGACRRA